MEKYSLVGVDGNAFAIMGYVCKALRDVGLGDLCSTYMGLATSSDYNNLLVVSLKYIESVNERVERK